jgi:hypothetical protein
MLATFARDPPALTLRRSACLTRSRESYPGNRLALVRSPPLENSDEEGNND